MTNENVVDANKKSCVSYDCGSVSSRSASTVRAPPQFPTFVLRYVVSKHSLLTNDFGEEGARAVTEAMKETRALRAYGLQNQG